MGKFSIGRRAVCGLVVTGSALTVGACGSTEQPDGSGSSLYATSTPAPATSVPPLPASGTPTSSDSKPTADDVARVLSSRPGIIMPGFWDYYRPTPEQEDLIAKASYVLTANCMKESGFTNLDPPPAPSQRSQDTSGYDLELGIIDFDRASKWGYQSIPQADQSAPVNDPGTSSQAYQQAHGKCQDQTDQTLNAGITPSEAALEAAYQIEVEAVEQARNDPAVVAALKQWRSCMTEQGFTYESPRAAYEAFGGFGQIGDKPSPSAEEITTAQTDARCKEPTGLVKLWTDAAYQAMETQINQHLPALTEFQQQTQQQIKNATTIIAQSTDSD